MTIEIERTENMWVRVIDREYGQSINSKSIEAHLLFAILEKLQEIHCAIEDVKSSAPNKEHR